MAIRVPCTFCGRQFRAKDAYRGRRTRCPDCGKPLVIEGPRVPDHDVFISYSSKDKAVADAVCAALESRKIRTWIAPRDIAPGAQWGEAIIEAIEDSRVMVLIYTAQANRSRQVVREVERAVNKGLVIVPLRVEDVAPSKGLEYFISASHWLDAVSPPLESHLDALATTLAGLIKSGDGGDHPSPSLPVTTAAAAGLSPWLRAHKPLIALGGAAALAATGVVVWAVLGSQSRREAPPVVPSPRASENRIPEELVRLKKDVEVAWTAIKDLRGANRIPEELVRLKADVEVAWAAVKDLRGGKGLDKLIDQATRRQNAAITFLEQKEFAPAISEYKATAETCQNVQRAVAQRKLATGAQEAAAQARKQGLQGGAPEARTPWMAAEKSMADARQAYALEDFSGAEREWKAAAAAYGAATRMAPGVRQFRKARDAYETDLLAYNLFTLQTRVADSWRKITQAVEAAEKSAAANAYTPAAEQYVKARQMLPSASPVHQKLRELPPKDLKFEFFELELSDALMFVYTVWNINVVVDWRAMKKIGVLPNTPVTVNATGKSCEDALKLVLASVSKDLDYAPVRSQAILISTKQALAVVRPAVSTRPADSPGMQDVKAARAAYEAELRSYDIQSPDGSAGEAWKRIVQLVQAAEQAAGEGLHGYAVDAYQRAKRMLPWASPPYRKLKETMVEAMPFSDFPFGDCMVFLNDLTQMTIVVDWGGLAKLGVTRETKVTIDLKNVTLETTLDLLLITIHPQLRYVAGKSPNVLISPR